MNGELGIKGGVIYLAVVFFIFLIIGCIKYIPDGEKVCSNIPDGSYSVICEAADFLHTSPETISSVIKGGNIAGILSDQYAAKQADQFIDKLLNRVDQYKLIPVTYEEFISEVVTLYTDLPEKVKIAFVLVEDYFSVSEALGAKKMSPYDWALISRHLMKQKTVITPFLLKG